MTDPTEILATRYGADRPRRRGRALALGIVVAVALTAWAVWAAASQGGQPIDAELTAYNVVSDHEVQVKVAVQIHDAGTTATCLVRATAEDHTVVGELNLTADQLRAEQGDWIPVRTERRATTAELVDCDG